MSTHTSTEFIRSLETLASDDKNIVGGKNASLGEMIQTLKAEGVHVPGGFATTSDAYWRFIDHNKIDEPLREQLDKLAANKQSLEDTGENIRKLFKDGEFSLDTETGFPDVVVINAAWGLGETVV